MTRRELVAIWTEGFEWLEQQRRSDALLAEIDRGYKTYDEFYGDVEGEDA